MHNTAKICHRDLKLDNILLQENYTIKNIDFGFATDLVKKDGTFVFENEEYYCLSVIYPKKTRKYYLKEKSEYLDWIKHFQIVTEYSTITDIYEIFVNILIY